MTRTGQASPGIAASESSGAASPGPRHQETGDRQDGRPGSTRINQGSSQPIRPASIVITPRIDVPTP